MDEHVRVNVGGTATVLDAAAGGRASSAAVHISSVVVYGYDDSSHQDEGAHLRNCGVPYIDTKSAADRLARRRGAVVVRPGDVYGPGSVPWALRPLEMAKAGQLAVQGSGAGRMLPGLHRRPGRGVVVALQRGEPGEAYAAWNDAERVSFEEFFNRFAEIGGGRPARRLPAPADPGAGDGRWRASPRSAGRPPSMTRHSSRPDRPPRARVSAAKLRALGWEPKVSLDEGMRRTEDVVPRRGPALGRPSLPRPPRLPSPPELPPFRPPRSKMASVRGREVAPEVGNDPLGFGCDLGPAVAQDPVAGVAQVEIPRPIGNNRRRRAMCGQDRRAQPRGDGRPRANRPCKDRRSRSASAARARGSIARRTRPRAG